MKNFRALGPGSPSVNLERGVGRLRAPTRRKQARSPSPPRSTLPSKLRRQDANSSSSRTCSLPVILLSAGILTVFIFIVLAFLLGRSWRWESLRLVLKFAQTSWLSENRPADADDLPPFRSQLRPISRITTPSQAVPHVPLPDERYLTWLPHSGFHNQRVSLENALILARMLNRTLIIPPIRLGKIIRYGEFDKLHRHVSLSSKFGLEHCARTSSFTSFVPNECFGYFEYTMLPWSALIDLHAVAQVVPVIERWDSSPAWLKRYMNITPSDTAYVKDSQPYQFQMYDDRSNLRPLKPKYAERMDVEDLHELYASYKLLEFGSLFGTSRFRLIHPQNKQTRREVRERMIFANSALLSVAREIARAVGEPNYYALHLRLGDGVFEDEGEANIRLLWYSLVTGLMGLPTRDAQVLEARIKGWSEEAVSEWPEPPSIIRPPVASRADVESSQLPFPRDDDKKDSQRRPPTSSCRQRMHSSISNLAALNAPIFIATDAPHPRTNPSLTLFTHTLPCLSFLSDFSSSLSSLDTTLNEDDGVPLKNFLLPFVDSMVASMAGRDRVLGTPRSTFSAFVVDVMNRMWHGLDIIERGI